MSEFTDTKSIMLAVWQGVAAVSVQDSLSQLDGICSEAKMQGAQLLVLPELFLGGYLLQGIVGIDPGGKEMARVRATAKREGIALILGYPEKQHDFVYNSSVAIDKNGCVVGNYRKTHLFGANEKKAFAPGNQGLGKVFEVDGVRVAMLICYDVEFPEAVRTCVLNGAQLVVVPTANMVPYDLINTILVRARAIENHIPVVYCNWGHFASSEHVVFNGRSSVVSPLGELILDFPLAPAPQARGVKAVEVVVQGGGLSYAGQDNYLRDRREGLYLPARI